MVVGQLIEVIDTTRQSGRLDRFGRDDAVSQDEVTLGEATANVAKKILFQLPRASRYAEAIFVEAVREPEVVTLEFGDVEPPAMIDPKALARIAAIRAIRAIVFPGDGDLIRGLMAQAAAEAGLLPWQLSFAGAVQTVVAFAPLAWASEQEEWEALGVALRVALREHRVCDRPGRVEPRKQKRRPQHYPLLMEPRASPKSLDPRTLCLKSVPFIHDLVSNPLKISPARERR